MSFYVNIGYRFPLPGNPIPNGSMILASSMPYHQLLRRKFDPHYHLVNRLFDPQLYLADLDAIECPEICTKLSSYPWFGVNNLKKYDSNVQNLPILSYVTGNSQFI